MVQKKKFKNIALLLSTIILFSFYQIDSTQLIEPWPPLVQQEYDRKIDEFKANRKRSCLEEILKDAEAYVDSTIVREINIKLLDTLIFPEKPFRPDYPQDIILDDSTKVAPIIK